MANLNKVQLIGRLTKDPETRTFANGGKVANIRFAVNNRKKNMQSGQWEDEPVYLDIKAFNRETGRKLADVVEQYCRKGSQIYVEGRLTVEEWEDKNGGGKRSAIKIIMDDVQLLDGRQIDGESGGMSRAPRAMNSAPPRTAGTSYGKPAGEGDYGGEDSAHSEGRDEDNIPF